MRTNKRVEKRPPKTWDLAFGIRRQLSGRGGRQRALAADNQLMVVLHQVPRAKSSPGHTVYFWRSREQEWHYSERGGGFSALENLIQRYDDRISELEETLANANDSRTRFQVLDEITPVLRSARNLSDALHKALELSELQAAESVISKAKELSVNEDKRARRRAAAAKAESESGNGEHAQPSKLQTASDHANDVARAAEVLKSDAESAIQFAHARQQEIQAHYVQQQSQAAHRLNILAATFLPVATISAVFGMNLQSGWEGTPVLFWFVVLMSIVIGAWIGVAVMNVRQLNPTDW